jgi:methionine sulfoxide reductase heme-binding subunit
VTSRDPLDYAWWLASRSAGIVAYLLLSAAVLAGLAMALRLGSPRLRRSLRALHEQLALVALGATAAHGLLLLADPWLRPGIAGLLVPFASSYRPIWTGLGVLAAYLAAALSLTYYVRGRVGARRWRRAHRLIPVAWALAAVHVVGAGTDAGSLWLQVPVALSAALVVALLGERVLGARRRPRAQLPPAPAAPSLPAAPATDGAPAPLWSRAAAGSDAGQGARSAALQLTRRAPPDSA